MRILNKNFEHSTRTPCQRLLRVPLQWVLRPTFTGFWTLITVSVLIAAGVPTAYANTAPTTGPVATFKAFFSHQQQPFLKRSQAYKLVVSAPTTTRLQAQFHIAPGYYLYQDKIHFVLLAPHHGVSIGPIVLPPATIEHNPYLGTLVIYKKSFGLSIPITGAHPGQTLTIRAHYQGCATRGICYPPVTHILHIVLPNTITARTRTTPTPPSLIAHAPVAQAPSPVAHEARTHTVSPLSRSAWIWAIVSAFGVGLLLTFTPCVLPMIPILSSILVGQGNTRLTKKTGALLSLAYVLGTGTTYAAAGAVAGATGQELQAYFENAWGIGALSALLILMALSLFDLYTIQMPSSLQSRLQGQANKIGSNSLMGAFTLGLVSALVVGACVSPLLVSVLGLAISTHSALLGAAIMFSIALGMGVILIALGIGAGYFLPKVGPWMNAVKETFGVVLLGVAIYLLGLLPAIPILLVWGAFFIVIGVFLGGTGRLRTDASRLQTLRAAIGVLLLLWGTLCVLGGLQGNRNPLHPLILTSMSRAAPAPTPLRFHPVTTPRALHRALRQARHNHEPAMVDFSASWCVDCMRLQHETFPNRAVQHALRGFMLIQADVTQDTIGTRALKREFGILGPPAVLFFNAEGRPLPLDNFYGYIGPHHLITLAHEVKNNA